MCILGKWHSYRNIYKKEQNQFFGETCEDFVDAGYRICDCCKKIQEFNFDSQGGWWKDLDDCRRKILMDKIYKENERWIIR
jgi:hypothetical protein